MYLCEDFVFISLMNLVYEEIPAFKKNTNMHVAWFDGIYIKL